VSTFLPTDYWTFTAMVVGPATVYASFIDYRERRVPNWLNAALAVSGVLAQFTYFGWNGVGIAVAGLLVGFGVLIVPWLMHAMGAGDVKLMAAIGAWFGPTLTVLAFGLGALIGGIIAIIMIMATGKLGHAYVNFGIILKKLTNRQTAFSEYGSVKSFGSTTTLLPYGIPLTIGSLVILAGRCLRWPMLP